MCSLFYQAKGRDDFNVLKTTVFCDLTISILSSLIFYVTIFMFCSSDVGNKSLSPTIPKQVQQNKAQNLSLKVFHIQIRSKHKGECSMSLSLSREKECVMLLMWLIISMIEVDKVNKMMLRMHKAGVTMMESSWDSGLCSDWSAAQN